MSTISIASVKAASKTKINAVYNYAAEYLIGCDLVIFRKNILGLSNDDPCLENYEEAKNIYVEQGSLAVKPILISKPIGYDYLLVNMLYNYLTTENVLIASYINDQYEIHQYIFDRIDQIATELNSNNNLKLKPSDFDTFLGDKFIGEYNSLFEDESNKISMAKFADIKKVLRVCLFPIMIDHTLNIKTKKTHNSTQQKHSSS